MAEEQLSNETGVRKYFYFIKEKVSSDWKDLAFHLGFEQADIDNIAGRNRDDKSRCMDLLEEWLKRNGERATIEALMGALSGAGLQSTVDGLKNKYNELHRPHVSDNQHRRQMKHEDQSKPAEQGSSIKDVFQESVKTYYEIRLTRFKPLIWNDNFTLTTGDIFTELELMQRDENRHKVPSQSSAAPVTGEQVRKLTSLDDLFNPKVTGQSKPPRCILIEGEAGGGKTTFLSKEALDAVSQKTELGRRHDIVLFIRLREVRGGEAIEEMVLDQCVPETTEGVNAQSIRAILQRNESRVLFLLDGYDELRPEARAAGQVIPKLLSGKMYPKSTIIITSRPSAGVQEHTQADCHVRIMGFSGEHAEQYVRKYFSIAGKPELAEELIRTSLLAVDLTHTPIFLMLVCILWEEDPEMVSPGTMTGLYSNLLTCLIRKHCKREGISMPEDGMPAEVADALLHLGKLALEALLRNETLVELTEVKRQTFQWELMLKLGVVSMEISASKLHPRKQLNFSHKTMQEFLAGRYVAHAVVNQDIVELLQLTSISKALELGNLLQFICGFDQPLSRAVMDELSNLSHREFSQLQPEVFKEWDHFLDKPEELKPAETYKQFVLLCLGILNERKELDILKTVSRALLISIFDIAINRRQHAGLKYYLENVRISDRTILDMLNISAMGALQFLEQMFTSLIPGLRLDLVMSGVTLDSADKTARLMSVLKKVPGLRALDLSRTELTPSSFQPLVRGFSHVPLLEELDLTRNRALGDAGMEVLQTGLSSVPHLAVLRLGIGHFFGGGGMTALGMLSLAPHMHHLVGLRELDISFNRIGDTGLWFLTAVLPIFTAMQVLVLEDIGISSASMRKLVSALRQSIRLIKLDISFNPMIGDPGLEFLADILPHFTAMKVLNLRWTGISDRGMSALVKALPHLVELQILDVAQNNIGESGIVSLVQTLCKPSGLDTEQNQPGDKSLTTAPHYNTTLRELYIGGSSPIPGDGKERITQIVSSLPEMSGVDISALLSDVCVYPLPTHLHLSDTAAKALAEALPRLHTLKRLNLQSVSMEPAGFQAVAQAAEEHPTLDFLGCGSRLAPEGADFTASCVRFIY